MKNKKLIGISGKISSGKDLTAKIINWLIWKETYPEDNDLTTFLTYWDSKPNGSLAHKKANVYEIKKFAGKLKEIVCLLTGCTMADLENQEFKDKPLGEEWRKYVGTTPTGPSTKLSKVYENMTYRTLLQKVGTDALRDVIHENIWVNALFSEFKPEYIACVDPAHDRPVEKGDIFVTGVDPKWLITDTRFPNELEAIKNRGGITIRINRSFEKSGIEPVDFVVEHYRDNHPSETALDNAEFDYVIDNDGSVEELIQKVKTILKQENIIS